MPDDLKKAAIAYHRWPTPGKLGIVATKPLATRRDLSLAYTPGVAAACELIVEDPQEVYGVTSRGNLVAVISNGTAVLGLGNIGPLASKPVMEGKAVLFKKFADVDVFDIEIDEKDPAMLIEVIARLEPTFGGINLEDIKAPECFEVERTLRKRMSIPVFHDDQHGAAIVVAAALTNALQLVGKKIEDIKLVASGAGAAGLATLGMLECLGLQRKNVTLLDINGVVYAGRTKGMNVYMEPYARETEARTLADAIGGADVFLGLSAPRLLTAEMVGRMAERPIVFALANPEPEIKPEIAQSAAPQAIVATGRSDYPNQVNNALCFPYLFRGALDVGATTINDAMTMAAVRVLASLARTDPPASVAAAYEGEILTFGPQYILPKPLDPRLIVEVSSAVAKAAMDSGVATKAIDDFAAYRDHLARLIGEPATAKERVAVPTALA
jgi:malate dehydrogenase (oxaloacetate-decarboxylating)(NADP+)